MPQQPLPQACPHPPCRTTPAAKGRVVLPINRRWRYSPKATAAAHERDFDDSAFARVTVPHTNIRLPWHSFDEKTYEFVSIYRRHFRLPAGARGRRVFVDFEGVMTASTVWLNGTRLGEYKGGFTPFSFELTRHIDWDRRQRSRRRSRLHRARRHPALRQRDRLPHLRRHLPRSSLRLVSPTFIENIFAQPKDVLSGNPSLDVQCFLSSTARTLHGHRAAPLKPLSTTATVSSPKPRRRCPAGSEGRHPHRPPRQSRRHRALGSEVAQALPRRSPPAASAHLARQRLAPHRLPRSQIHAAGLLAQRQSRQAARPRPPSDLPLGGPGHARAACSASDAVILRKNLNCNIVRTSHYPQSRHFLDACDEIGLLVLEEIPGWQHIGDQAWQDIAVDNVGRMIRRDWNHPSIILWGVRINESQDNHDFYTRTNALAHQLDPTRQTGGIRYLYDSELLEDVFTMNDFGFPLRPPNHPLYLNTEFVGHTYPTKTIDNIERLREHTLRHARIHDQLASDPQYAGGIGWCAFDYNTHGNFGSGDRICYHGVTDIFREPKPAAGFYKSQCDPDEEIVLEPAFHWARGDENVGFTNALVCSNCDHLKFYVNGKLRGRGRSRPHAVPASQVPALRRRPHQLP